ncbi:MAG: xanthine dehydrogenase family protein, partial [Spirochaetaceae bacterium]|nr:xanthine dehydrogenase family protein [Spirochaetaceae bacterium]
KTAGYTKYIADMDFGDVLYGKFFRSSRSRARIIRVKKPALPDGYYIVDKDDVPGENAIHMINADWPVFADDMVRFQGQSIALVVGPDRKTLEEIVSGFEVEYEDLPGVFSIDDSLALKGGALHGSDNCFGDYNLEKGDPDKAFAEADRIYENSYETGIQEHIYMETQGVVGLWKDGKVNIHGSLQCPFYVRHAVTPVLGTGDEGVRVIQAPTGGAFGGKEHFPDILTTALAVAVTKLKKKIAIFFEREEDIVCSVKRHPSRIRIRTALDKKGNITAIDIDSILDGGAFESCSCIVLQRTVFHATGVYSIPNTRCRGRVVATNHVPFDAFRGFGAPQAIFAIESHMTHLAELAGVDTLEYKKRYFLKKGDVTITNGEIHENVKLNEMIARAKGMSDYDRKVSEYGTGRSRGIGLTLFNHGGAFTGNGEKEIINANVKVRKRKDNRVEFYVSNVEMGQGLHTTFSKIAAHTLEIPIEDIIYIQPDTDIVPDSGPTVASRSIVIVGTLVGKAAAKLKEQWVDGEEITVWQQYESPKNVIPWDQATMQGDAYPSYSWGVNVVEVEFDKVTCEVKIVGAWNVFDVGVPIDSLVVEGQIEGGLVQSLGWAYLEKMEIKEGRIQQRTMADYVIPTSLDVPVIKNDFVLNPYDDGVFGAKGAGEIVHNGGAPAFLEAVQMAAGAQFNSIPLTPETIMEKLK